jgi:DNA-3-methyladenine glycosylase I
LKVRSLSRSYCVQVLKKTFVFTGGEILKELLVSAGYLPGAHDEDCPIYAKIARLQPAWMRVQSHSG